MKLFLGGIVAIGLSTVSLHAQTGGNPLTDTTYTGGSSGTFEVGSNYDNGAPGPNNGPGFGPGTGATIIINQTQSDTVNSFSVFNGGTLQFNSGGNTLTITGFEPTSGNENISVNGGSTLNFGGGSLVFKDGIFQVGDNSGSGTFNLQSGSFNYDQQTTADDTQLTVGNGGTGVVNQSGSSSVTTGNALFIGSMGGSGTYNLRGSATLQTGTQITSPGGTYFIIVGSDADAGTSGTQGTLNISDSSKLTLNADSILTIGDATTILGSGAGLPASVQSVGVVNQTGSSTVVVDGGRISVGTYTGATGTYNLRSGTIQMTGGELDIASGATGATGVFNQSGGMITADGASSVFIGVLAPGATGSGTYNLSNGIADFNSGLEIGEIGSVNQTGGALTVAAGGTIDLSTAGGSYNLKGGSLTVGTDSLIGSAHEGHFNFGGGTLDATGDLTDALDGTLSGNSTINAAGTLILSGTVTGNGALTLTEGTLNASTVNLPQISGVTLRTGTAFNLTVSSNASNTQDTFTGKISGTGNLTTGGVRTSNEGTPIATPATGYRLILPNGVDLTGGSTTITANTALQVSGGTLNTITGGGNTTFEVGQRRRRLADRPWHRHGDDDRC